MVITQLGYKVGFWPPYRPVSPWRVSGLVEFTRWVESGFGKDFGLSVLTSKRPDPHPVSIDSNDFNVLAHPIPRQVYAAAVPGFFNFFFDQLFSEDPELDFGGLALLFCPCADLFMVRISFQSDHILLHYGGNTFYFPLADILGNARWHRPNVRLQEKHPVKRINLV